MAASVSMKVADSSGRISGGYELKHSWETGASASSNVSPDPFKLNSSGNLGITLTAAIFKVGFATDMVKAMDPQYSVHLIPEWNPQVTLDSGTSGGCGR